MNTQNGYDDDPSWRRTATVAIVAAVALCAIVGWFVVRPAIPDSSDDHPRVAAVPPSSVDDTEATAIPDTEPADVTTTRPPVTTTAATSPTSRASEEAVVATDDPVDDTTVGTTADETADGPDGTEQVSTDGAAGDPAAGGTTTTSVAGATTSAAPAPAGSVTYDTLPDGSPAPVVAVYGTDQITITGAVPSATAKDRLQALAIANAKPGQATNIANFLTINPDVPIGVGVRVVELTSARFPESSAQVLPAHAAELNRAVAIMNALPKVTALVIGHADQRGDPEVNYALSGERADAVVNYMVGQGIAPSRLSSRAVGANDLLTLNNDAVSLALNRRTEFVFYGLLVE